MHFVPSMLKSFIEYLNAKSGWHNLSTLERVFSSGEALPPETVKEFYSNTENIALINLCGPTEATVDVSYYNCIRSKSFCSIPIGKPIDNIQLYILDSHLNLQPIGVVGELYISGDGLARGYINNEELTKKSFIPNPFLEGKRMYKTGDLARWYSQGDIEYIGRIDHQIKIRGHRIELNEIKHQILKDKTVKDVLVICKEYNNSKHIFAYIIFNSEGDLNNIKNQLKKVLPTYMIPSFFIEVKEFPVSGNGKIDFKKLPEPVLVAEEADEHRSELENELISLWEDILKIRIPSVNSDFFESGGDSLAAIQLATRIDSITIEDIYQNPTVRMLANVIENKINSDNSILIPYKKFYMKKQTALVCFPYGGGSGIIYKELFDEISKLDEGYNLFSVNLPGHSLNDTGRQKFISLDEAADLIVDELKKKDYKEVVLYGHCVGSALTLLTALKLKNTSIQVKAVCLGGILPSKTAKYLGNYIYPWAMASDGFILNFLKRVGFEKDSIPDEFLPYMIKAFRYDVKSYYKFLYQFNRKTYNKDIPIYLIFGENDPMTKNYSTRYRDWLDYSNRVEYKFIPGASHYFIKTHSSSLANILLDIGRGINDVAI
jgi:surfactin synthase thioesterase subunit